MDKINIKFKPMMCPVCDEMYFSGPNKNSYDGEIEEYLNGEVQCSHCGWIYDLYQAENPDYDYSEEHMPEPKPHKCPICGEYEFADELSSDICPVCGWEDTGFEDMPDEKPSEYMMSFNERLAWFKEKRKENPKYKWIDDEKLDS